MKKAIRCGMLSVFMVLASALIIGCATTEGFNYSCGDDTTSVTFTDAGLDAAVRAAIGKPTGTILQKDLCDLTSLDAADRGITDLSGIENCTALEHLDLGSYNPALTALTDGTSRITAIDYNQIIDISLLSGLTNLSFLDLASNRITDIGALVDNDGLGDGDTIDLRLNSLDTGDCEDILTLIDRGITVQYSVNCTL